jgi:hypothetical protein
MLLSLLLVVSIGSGALYDLFTNTHSGDFQGWRLGTFIVFGVWLLFSFKDWMAYFKLYRQNKQLINDERFVYDNHIAAKVGFVGLIFSNFALLLIDLSIYPLSGAFVAIFSLTFGISLYLLTLVVQELRA